MFKCERCDKTFEKPDTFRKHNYRNHNDKFPLTIFKCYHCRYTSKYKFNLDKHVKKHLRLPKEKVGILHLNVCPLCNKFKCADRESMIYHYHDVHEIRIAKRKLYFPDDDQFLAWKREIESVGYRYVTYGGARKRLNVTVKYLRCFRDGHYTPMGTGRRKLKVKGSCKIGSVCPSSMKVAKNATTGTIVVTYIARHVGHDSNIDQMNVTDVSTLHQLSEVPISSIFDSYCDSIFENQVTIQLTTPEPSPSIEDNSGDESGQSGNINDNISQVETQTVVSVETQFEIAKRALNDEICALIDSATNLAQLEIIKKACSPLPHAIKALEPVVTLVNAEPLLENANSSDGVRELNVNNEKEEFSDNFLLPDYNIRVLIDVKKENG